MIGALLAGVLAVTQSDQEGVSQATFDSLVNLAKVEQANIALYLPAGLELDFESRQPMGLRSYQLLATFTNQKLLELNEGIVLCPSSEGRKGLREARLKIGAWLHNLSAESALALRDGVRLSSLPSEIQREILGGVDLPSWSLGRLMEGAIDPEIRLNLAIDFTVFENSEEIDRFGSSNSDSRELMASAAKIESTPLVAEPIANRREGKIYFGDGVVLSLSSLAGLIEEAGGDKRIALDPRTADQLVFVAGGYSVEGAMEILEILSDSEPAREIANEPDQVSARSVLDYHKELFDEKLVQWLGIDSEEGIWDKRFSGEEPKWLKDKLQSRQSLANRDLSGLQVEFSPILSLEMNFGAIDLNPSEELPPTYQIIPLKILILR